METLLILHSQFVLIQNSNHFFKHHVMPQILESKLLVLMFHFAILAMLSTKFLMQQHMKLTEKHIKLNQYQTFLAT